MIVFFDTETTGRLDFKAPPEAPGQPDVVQLAACLTDDDGDRIFGQINLIIEPPDPERRWIPEDLIKVHGISDNIARVAGQPRRTVLSAFNHLCKHADRLVAYNIDFDHPVMLTAYHREGVPHRMDHMQRFCAMKAATPILKLPKPPGKWKPNPNDQYKWPSLAEAHQHFLGEGFDGAHNAMNDVLALIRVYRALLQAS